MPTIRKVPATEAAAWSLESEPAVPDAGALLAAVAGDDRTGLTRMDYPAKRMHGWMARVYAGGRTITRFWADGAHGGARRALRKAVDWRDAMRQMNQRPPPRGRTWRIVRVDRPEHKNIGYFAYAGARRRYFSDAAYGGADGARASAEAWLAERRQEEG